MVALLSERKYDVIISAPNRGIEVGNLRPLRTELPAVWLDISVVGKKLQRNESSLGKDGLANQSLTSDCTSPIG